MSIKGLLYLAFSYAMRLGWKWWLRALVVATGAYVLAAGDRDSAYARCGRASIGAACSVSLLAGYVVLMLAFTVLGRAPRAFEHPLNLDLFGTLARRLRPGSSNEYEILLNMALFLPVGMLLPVVTGWNCRRTMLSTFVLSCSIEVAQLVLSRGTCEVSDVFTNVSGGFMGYGLCVIACTLGRYRTGTMTCPLPHRWCK